MVWKKNNQREVTKNWERKSNLFVGDTFSEPHTPSYGTHISVEEKKKKINNQREVTQKLRKQSFLNGTHRLDLIHIVIKFHQDILYSYQVIARIRIWKKKIKGK